MRALQGGAIMLDSLWNFLKTTDYAPHGYCLLWQPELIWTHVLSDALIAAAYFSIPVALVHFIRKRSDIEFRAIFWLFATFILACGATHIMAIWTLWRADYGVEALIKVVTALASVGTAILLWRLIPQMLAIPSPGSLRAANAELAQRVAERDAALGELREEIAGRARAQEALFQAQKMEAMGQLTGGIAHDFNNLLQAVGGNLELIAHGADDADRTRRRAENAAKAIDRGRTLTSQLLAFSRTQRLELRPVRVTPLVENMLEMLGRTLGPSIRIETAFEDGELAVLGDQAQLELAILSLAINARDAMPDGGTLRIETELVPDGDEGDRVQIRVIDTGTGMTEEVAARAFEPFFTTKTVGKGTGLGLSMIYGMATQSGGSVALDSVPGSGTCVVLTLKRAPLPAEVASPAEDEAPHVSRQGIAVLVVDDDDAVRATVADGLRALGHEVIEASNGQDALTLLEHHRPDLLVLDYAMPGLNGAEVAVRARRSRPDLPILFASGYSDSQALLRALGADAAILRKPFTIAELARSVATTLAKAA
jgi:signal transduction histidine kinase/CheY-like chemotaxis protein